MLGRIVGLALLIASGAGLMGIKALELPGVITFILVVGVVTVFMGGVVILFAEEALLFRRVRASKVRAKSKARGSLTVPEIAPQSQFPRM